MTIGEAEGIIREVVAAKPSQGTLLYRCAEAISMLLEELHQLERELERAYFAED